MKIKENIAISESGFVFDSETGETYNLNETGVVIVNLLKQGKTDEDIKKYIIANYEVDTNTLENCYGDFLASLVMFNLLKN